MNQNAALTQATLKTPRAASIAGILFSLLLTAVFWLFWISVPSDPEESGAWLRASAGTVVLALNLVPLAGIAFLWFIGVLRDRLGRHEDRFFATVFFGSGLLFLATLFVAAAMVGAILIASAARPEQLIDSVTFHFARAAVYTLMSVYMIKMAGVFMITASMLAIHTGLAPRWLAILGVILALLLILGSYFLSLSVFVFPAWVLLISVYMMKNDRRPASKTLSRRN